MVNEIKKNEIERRPLLQRVLSTALTGMLAMSACGMSMGTFAVEALGAPCDGLLAENAVTRLVANDVSATAPAEGVSTSDGESMPSETPAVSEETEDVEEANEAISTLFVTGDATVYCGGETITGQQAVMVSPEKELAFTVTPSEGFAVEDVSFQMLSEGILDVLEPTESAEGVLYAVPAEKMTEGMAIVVNTVALPSEEPLLPSSPQGGEASLNELVVEPPFDHTTLPVTLQTPSVKVKDVEKVYDGQPISVEASAVKGGSTLLYYTDGMSGWSAENPRFTDAGTYTVLVKAIDPSSSEADVATAHVTVTPAPVIIEVHDAEKTVGNVDPVFDGAVEGLIPGDAIGSVVYYRLNSGTEDVGFYADVLSALVQHRNSNYAYTVTAGSFTIKGSAAMSDQGPMNESTMSRDSSDPTQPESAQKLVAELFAQGESMQRLTEGVVEPIATLLGVANGSPITIADDDTPLAAFEENEQEGRWTNLLVVFGSLILAVVGAIAVFLRLRRPGFMSDELDEGRTRDLDLDEEDALPALDALYSR